MTDFTPSLALRALDGDLHRQVALDHRRLGQQMPRDFTGLQTGGGRPLTGVRVMQGARGDDLPLHWTGWVVWLKLP